MQEKYPNVSTYAYCANNPVKYIDPNGKEIDCYEAVKVDVIKENSLSSKTTSAFLRFAQSKTGLAFFSLFAKKGNKIGSILFAENGKYSDVSFNILDVSLSKETADGGYGDLAEAFIYLEIIDGKPVITMQLNSFMGGDANGVTEDIVHETQIHGYTTIIRELEVFQKGGQKALDEYRAKKNNSTDHAALKNKDINHKGYDLYKKVCQELMQVIIGFDKTYNEAQKKYQINY
ncbi:hypothetical protein FACS189434_14340 [Bacteroidia bacterium]|nr:hypothetical protein FACS189434_14340 [Bacteroidia bacterium]